MQKTASAPNIPASSTSSRNTIRAQVWKQPSTERASTRWLAPKKVNGAWNIYSTLNDGKNQTETIILSTAKENYANYTYLGAGNDPKDAKKNGFIMGLSNFSGPVAWDRQCPNCLEQYGGTNYPLEWTGNRQSVICDKCKRIYSLENGTITSGGKSKSDKPLMQYRVTYGGQGTDIYVGN